LNIPETICPFCGSVNIRTQIEEVTSNTITKGLPKGFFEGEWFYFVCKDCLEKSCDTQDDSDFVFTVIDGRYYIYYGRIQTWIRKGYAKEQVKFT
jgi:hypothetical protein